MNQSTMSRMKIYISGNIEGMNPDEYLPTFEAAEKDLIAAGVQQCDIVNPTKLSIPQNGCWADAMKVKKNALDNCTSIYMLRSWRDSLDARRELNHAGIKRMDVYFEASNDARMIADCINAGVL